MSVEARRGLQILVTVLGLQVCLAPCDALPSSQQPARGPDLFAPDVDLMFEHITVDDGLPENSVRAILQDSSGFLWLGTQNGLVRFDGHEMIVFSPSANESLGFGGRTVLALHEDDEERIWIGTLLNGLWVYDPLQDVFLPVELGQAGERPSDAQAVAGLGEDRTGRLWIGLQNELVSLHPQTGELTRHADATPPEGWSEEAAITSVLADGRGRIWCGTDGAGLALYVPGEGSRWFRHDEDDPHSLPSDVVHQVVQAPDGRIWIAAEGGLSLWQETNEGFQNHVPPVAVDAPGASLFVRIAIDDSGMLWIGSANGLYVFDPRRSRFRRFQHDRQRTTSLVNGPILSLFIDRSGIIWAGSWHTGLNKVNPANGLFHVREFSTLVASDRDASVEAILEDQAGTLWVGTSDVPRGRGNGQVFARRRGDYVALRVQASEEHALSSVLSLAEDRRGAIWVGSYRGLWRVEGETVVPAEAGQGETRAALEQSAIQTIAIDSGERLWMATWSGLFVWDPRTNSLEQHRHDPQDPTSLSEDVLTTVHLDRHNRVWVGTDTRGLNLMESDGQTFRRMFDPDRGLETVTDIHESTEGKLWLATFSGLVQFDPATGESRLYDHKGGLPNDEVVSILEDRLGRLWLSTGYGLARFDQAEQRFRNYDLRDGLPDNEVKFARHAGHDGRLYFGGSRGMVSFDPTHFTTSTYEPEVVITNITISDSPLRVGPKSPLTAALHHSDRLELRHDQNDLSFSFASLDYARPYRNQYRFRLEGYDRNWRVPSRSRTASYTNLAAGQYRFQVLGSNRDGIFGDQPAALEIVIRPPWWRTGWAYACYGLVSLLLAYALYRQLTQRERMRSQIELQRARAEQLQEVDRLKSKLLTNITHEFRTPLTLIKAQLKRVHPDEESEERIRIDSVVRNADRLEQLIDQLLDLSRLEAGNLPLRFDQSNTMAFLRVLVSAFESLAIQREIALETSIPDNGGPVWFDADVLEKIVGNLLSNALKFTPRGGRVTVTAHMGAQVTPAYVPGLTGADANGVTVLARQLVVSVANSGAYLDPAERAMVFERFYRASTVGGSGVGLALVKELTEWIGGTIEVESSPEQGTRFTVRIPTLLSHPQGETADEAGEIDDFADLSPISEDQEAGLLVDAGVGDEPRILVVEDHAEMRAFICRDLAPEYRVLEADNGQLALDLAIAEIPDLVLSDVMMPEMDGFELCLRLKEDERTSHVPVILLTALSEAESRHRGLRKGADDYLAKPFDADELKLRIRNLIEQRRKLAKRYEDLLAELSPDVKHVPSAEDRFVLQVRKIIEAHLDDPDFRIDRLCREVCMSRSQLHRKLKAVTGKTTSDFVRTYRLRRSAQLLEAGYGNVTEVAYAVGFHSLSYFSRSFRDLYGVQPSEYLRRRRCSSTEANGGPPSSSTSLQEDEDS